MIRWSWKHLLTVAGVGVAALGLVVLVHIAASLLAEPAVAGSPESVLFIVPGKTSPSGTMVDPARIVQVLLTGEVRTVYTAPTHDIGAPLILRDGSMVAVERYYNPRRHEYFHTVVDGFPGSDGWARRFANERLESGGAGPPALSPDRNHVAAVVVPADRATIPERRLVVVDTAGSSLDVVALPARMIPYFPAWSPNGDRIAFYFARAAMYFDPSCTMLGLAVTDLEGNVAVLAEPSLIRHFPGAKYSQPFWGSDGKAIYFTAGPQPEVEPPSGWPDNAAYTYQYDVTRGNTTLVSVGEVFEMAPDGSFLLLRFCPGEKLVEASGPIHRERQTWQIYLRTGSQTVLPNAVWSSKLSPSGKHAVTSSFIESRSDLSILRFYRTSDWRQVRSVRIPRDGFRLDLWPEHCVWISQDAAPGGAGAQRRDGAGTKASTDTKGGNQDGN